MPKSIEAQTNDTLLSLDAFDCATDFTSEKILFHDANTTALSLTGVTLRKLVESDRDRVFPHKLEGVGDWLLESGGEIVATGGIYTHYNPPYGDISMEVNEKLWKRGYGSYLVQELKRTCYEMGKIPAAALQRGQHCFTGHIAEGGLPAVCAHSSRSHFDVTDSRRRSRRVTRLALPSTGRFAWSTSMGLLDRLFGGGKKRLAYQAGAARVFMTFGKMTLSKAS